MSVTNADIIAYGAANMPEDDSSTTGGAIDRSKKVAFTALAADDTIDVVSDSASDLGPVVTITGRLANGTIDTEDYTLAGTSQQTGSTIFERVMKATLASASGYLGTVTIEKNGGPTLITMEGSGVNPDTPGGSGVYEVRRMFYGAAASGVGDGAKTLYEKMFIANTHATLALTTSTIELTTDSTASGIVDFDLEGSVNDNNSVTDRTTSPDGGDMLGAPDWDNDSKIVPGGNLGDRTTGLSDHVGVWVRLSLGDGQPAEKSDFTLTTDGNTT